MGSNGRDDSILIAGAMEAYRSWPCGARTSHYVVNHRIENVVRL